MPFDFIQSPYKESRNHVPSPHSLTTNKLAFRQPKTVVPRVVCPLETVANGIVVITPTAMTILLVFPEIYEEQHYQTEA